MLDFLKGLPKVELHAHLNGSLNLASLQELGQRLLGHNSAEFHQRCEDLVRFESQDAKLEECFKKFALVHELTSTKEGLQLATELVIRDFALDNVQYVELRTTPKANELFQRREYLLYVLETIQTASLKYPRIKVKLLASINRAEPVAVAEETVSLAIEFAKSHPNILVGLDLSGNPHRGEFRDFIPVLKLARDQGLKLAIHCAEIENPLEIKEMLDFGMSRCGHGTFLTPANLAQLKQRHIAVECCLTSNVKCGTVNSYQEHHLQRLLEADIPKVLCTDDCGVFNTTLTNEFYLATETFGLLAIDCIALTKEAVKHSFASEDEKLKMLSIVDKFWESARLNLK